MPQWSDQDYGDSEFQFNSISDNQDYSPSAQNMTGTQQWSLDPNSEDPTSIMMDSPSNTSNASVSTHAQARTLSQASSSPEALHTKGFCPLIAGLTQECVPQYCGVDAPCVQNGTGLPEVPEIEDCDMAAYAANSSEQSSPQEAQREKASATSESAPPPQEGSRQKRASTGNKSGQSNAAGSGHSRGRQAHSLVERKYRENLNAKLEELHDAIQGIQMGRKSGNRSAVQSQPALGSGGKARKSDILAEAITYIYQSQVDMRHMADEIGRLKALTKPEEKQINKCEDCSLRKQVMKLRLLADTAD